MIFQSTRHDITVCVCTHNPRKDYLGRVVESLNAQSFARDRWELLIVANRCDEPVESLIELGAIENVRIVSEEKLGLTHARMKGILEARGELILFVDDDNVLESDYLASAWGIMEEHPFLGVIGGKCVGEFETAPPRWSRHFLPYLAVLDYGDEAKWGLEKNTYLGWYPIGAGMVIRRELAQKYATEIVTDEIRQRLGRQGTSLSGADDVDMVLTAMDDGLGVGYFPELKLTHLIPAFRLRYDYIRRLIYHSIFSYSQLLYLRDPQMRPYPWPLGYLASLLVCLRHRQWHPVTMVLAMQVAHGRYAAFRDFKRKQRELKRARSGAGGSSH